MQREYHFYLVNIKLTAVAPWYNRKWFDDFSNKKVEKYHKYAERMMDDN